MAVDDVAATDTVPADVASADDTVAGGAPGPRWQAGGGQGSGWRPDPTDRFDQRWWDGTRFTRRVQHGDAVATDTVSPPRSGGRRRRGGGRQGGPGWRPDPDGEGERYHDGQDWTAKRRPAGASGTEGRPGSLWAWLPRSVVLALGLATVLALVLVVVVVAALMS